jgi:phosphatidylserine/phosphatidylglycerophosphate/cardiolipin synthase-like enzyme
MIRSIKIILLVLLATSAVDRASAQSVSISHKPWYESEVDSNKIIFNWETSVPSASEVVVGADLPQPIIDSVNNSMTTEHTIEVSSLSSHTIYFVKLLSRAASSADSVFLFTSTSSGKLSTDSIQIYFNRSVDSTTLPQLPRALGNADYLSLLLSRIESAQHSVDFALYDFSGSIGSTVVGALLDAQARGVKIRLIMDSTESNSSSAYYELASQGIPVITNGFGLTGNLWQNAHHNNFIVFDGRGDYPADAWIQSGSWNLTNQGTTSDFQNLIYIQDESLALAYEREFNDEWGSTGDTPDSANSRFSYRKSDVAPHSFDIGGKTVHLLFSPQDHIASAIGGEIDSASSQILFSEYNFTLPNIAQDLVNAYHNHIGVHGITGSGGANDQTPFLQSSGLDVIHFSDYLNQDTLFYHKYCLIDPGKEDATVLTGSFDWTQSADSLNNENILFIQDSTVSDFFLQEWIQRYHENGGTLVYQPSGVRIESIQSSGIDVYPNPASKEFEIAWLQESSGPARIYVVDPLGRILIDEIEIRQSGENREMIQNDWPSGSYYIRVESQGASIGACIIIEK